MAPFLGNFLPHLLKRKVSPSSSKTVSLVRSELKLGVMEDEHFDEFLFLSPSIQRCKENLAAFITLCKLIGVPCPLAPCKMLGPTTYIPFLGTMLDAVRMEARLHDGKLAKALLLSFQSRQKVTLQERQLLVCFFNCACSVIIPGRPLLCCLTELTKGFHRHQHHIRLTRQTKLDLELWMTFLQSFNGRSFF